MAPRSAQALQIIQRVDDATADLPIGRTGAVGPVLFQRAAGKAEESRSFGVRRYRGGKPAIGSGI